MSSAPLTKKTYNSQQSTSAWGRHQIYMRDYVTNSNPSNTQQHQTRTVKTENEILKENHRFLRSDREDEELTWEQRIAKKYYDKLFKEYALVDLRLYKEGRFAVRWRNEKEVIQGKGQFTCASLRCVESSGLQSWEINFAYVEDGEKKNALVKVRLCNGCSYKLNYKKQQKRAEPKSNVDRVGSKDLDEKVSEFSDSKRPSKRPSRGYRRSATSKVETAAANARLDDAETRPATKSDIYTRNDDVASRSSPAALAGQSLREQVGSEKQPKQEGCDSNANRKRQAEDDAERFFDDLLL